MGYMEKEIYNDKLADIVASYISITYPTLLKPLSKIKNPLGLDEYSDDEDNSWIFINGTRELIHGKNFTHYEISSELTNVYVIFGEEGLLSFFFKYHNIDLSNKSGFDRSWIFY